MDIPFHSMIDTFMNSQWMLFMVFAPHASSVSRSAHTAASGSLPFLGVTPLAGALDLRLSPGFPT